MSYDIPLHIDADTPEGRAVKRVMRSKKVGPEEAVRSILRGAGNTGEASSVKGSKKAKPDTSRAPLTDADWEKLKELDPGFAFFESMPPETIDDIERASKEIRAERLKRRA